MNTIEGLEIEKDYYGNDYVENVPLRTVVRWLEDESCEFNHYYSSLSKDKKGFMRLVLKGEIEGKSLRIYTKYFPECECFCTYNHFDVYGISLGGDYKNNRLGLAKEISLNVLDDDEYIPPKWKEEKKENDCAGIELVCRDKKITLCKGGKRK